MRRDWLLYLVIFSLALNLGTIGTFAYLRYQDQMARVAPAGPPPPLPPRVLWRELRLTKDQRQTLRALFPEHRRNVATVRQELAQKRRELFGLIKDDANLDAIRSKVREISTLQGNLEEEMLRFMLAVKKNLNPQQQSAFLTLLRMRLCGPAACGPMGPGFRRHHGPGMGHRMGPGGGPPMEFPTK